jgi:hypothetical protein
MVMVSIHRANLTDAELVRELGLGGHAVVSAWKAADLQQDFEET